MLVVVLGIGTLFIALGFLLNENNAKYLLSGYNTMSPEEQAKFPIGSYLIVFKKFHLWLGLLFMGGAILIQWLEPEWLGYHLAFTPLLAYLGFFIKYRSFSEGLNATNKTMTYIGIGILVCTLVGMVFLFRWSERPNTILFSEKSLVIDGPYGLELAYEDILDVRPLGVLPEITVRTNGIATGKASKGKFKDAEGQKYLLLIDHPAESYVLIERVHGEPLIVSLQNLPEDWMIELLEKLDTRE